MADAGVASRRKCEEIILADRVEVNGRLVNTLGSKISPDTDVVMVDGKTIDVAGIYREYIVLHKPRGYVTTVSDPEGRDTVMDLVFGNQSRIYPVGRLDYLSEGLLIMTNDGEFANHVMHPSFEVTKVYEVKVFGKLTPAILKKLRNGVAVEDGFLRPLSVRVLKELPNKTWLEFMLNEGKNREIRRLCEAVGLTVDKLKRVAIENLTINGIAPGKYRQFTKKEIYSLLNLNENGSRKSGAKMDYFSPKKTIKLRPQRGEFRRADDDKFQKYRKETYFETIKLQKEIQAEMNAQVTPHA